MKKIFFFALFAMPLLGFAQAKEPTDKKLWNEQNAEATYSEMAERIQKAEASAIELLNDAKFDSDYLIGPVKQTLYAIKYLGVIRSQNGVPVLCKQLMFKQFFNSIVGDRLLYPASAALVNIGTPAIDGLLAEITQTGTSVEYRRVALGVLEEISGAEKVLPLLKESRAKQNEDGGKRLDVLISEFEQHLKKIEENDGGK